MAQRTIYDLSPEISEAIAVFPGDTPFRRESLLSFAQGANLDLSTIRTTVHLGAHTDAPCHYHPRGVGMSERPLHLYLGTAQVIHVRLPRGERIRPDHVDPREILAPRVLFGTGSFPDPDRWNSDFNSLSPELVDWLHARGVILVGIDTPSVDPEHSKALESHQAIYRHDLAVLEGIVLTDVPEGVYEFAALPLRIRGADASPVRAVLWRDGPAAPGERKGSPHA
jgi:arylformamidase